MRVRFWGTRGSTPVPLIAEAVAAKLARAAERIAAGAALADLPFHLRATYGGNTACVEILGAGPERLVLDAGTGLRELGRTLAAPPATYHILLSHTHWDHIMGLPFFAPIYQRGSRIVFYGCHPQLEARLAAQYDPAHFPVRFERLPAGFEFVRLKPGQPAAIAGATVTAFAQRHPGASYGYRVESGGKALVYSTDSEHKGGDDARSARFTAFCAAADLLIFDAMYPFVEACTDKAGWGHSSNITGIELAKRAQVRRLCLFHHDPALDDEALDRRLEESVRYADHYHPEQPLAVSMAYDGLEITI